MENNVRTPGDLENLPTDATEVEVFDKLTEDWTRNSAELPFPDLRDTLETPKMNLPSTLNEN